MTSELGSGSEDSGSRRIAIVDIGTNTIKFSVFNIPALGVPRLLASDAETVRLGADLDQTGMIGDERSLRAIAALERFERDAITYAADALIGVATEAFRSASNGADVLAAIHASTGWRLRVIDGLEEARLTFRGLRSQLERFPACIVADIGGGSTEVLHVSAGSLLRSISIPIGSGRFADVYFAKASPTSQAIAQARRAAANAFTSMSPGLPDELPLVLSGGNGVFLDRLATLVTHDDGLTRKSLERVTTELVNRPASAIARLLTISVERAAVLPAGAAISLGAIDAFGSTAVAAVPSGIREGVLWECLEAQGSMNCGIGDEHVSGQVE